MARVSRLQTWFVVGMEQGRSKIIQENPIGNGLDAFRATFEATCQDRGILSTSSALRLLTEEDLQELALDLLSALQSLRASRLLPSRGRGNHLRTDLLKLATTISSNDADLDGIRPLLYAVVIQNADDTTIWKQIYAAVTEPTPRPRIIASSDQQTPWLHSTAGFAKSSEYCKDVDRVLKEELGAMYVGIPGFYKIFFGAIPDLELASTAVFEKCVEGDDPLFYNGWKDWPKDANQDKVLTWFSEICGRLWDLADEHQPTTTLKRRPLAQSRKPIQGSTAERKLDVGFVIDPDADTNSRYHWSQILVPGELKSNPSADTAPKAWLDLGRYAREILAVQDSRRFVLGFTLCGSLMRLWVFDRLGGIASLNFDINQDGEQFVFTILGLLWMSEECLGFDPTIVSSGERRYIEIERNGQTERLIIDGVIKRAPCVAGRATTCWRAHRDGGSRPLIIKDSWQYPEREEEGELLREATTKDVVNVARYYHHETVCIRGRDDDVQNNIRAGLDVRDAANYRASSTPVKQPTTVSAQQMGRSTSITVRKRSSTYTDTPLPPSKRSRSISPTKSSTITVANRVHRRIILEDVGKPIYKASSRVSLLAALDACISGHESLRLKAGILQQDISINNLMINEDENNPSWPAFLIDLDLAIKERRQGASGANGKTGTRVFMAISVLLGEQHSFMHDLESFFWVLYWICIHYEGPNQGRVVQEFDQWNFISMESLADLKKGRVSHEGDFLKATKENFTQYYQSLVPWVNRLRKVVFPNGGRWEKEDAGLYSSMKTILCEAQKDPEVLIDV